MARLNGRESFDPDNGPSDLSFNWNQTGGVLVSLSDSTSSEPVFVPGSKGNYRFELTVSDSESASSPVVAEVVVPRLGDVDLDDDVDNADLNLVLAAREQHASSPSDLRDLNGDGTIDDADVAQLFPLCGSACNHVPTASAGVDRTVEAASHAGASVTLNGSASSDSDGDPLSYTWTGPFGTAFGPAPTVTLPLGANVITLTLNDGKNGTATATVTITVVDTIAPVVSYSGNSGAYTVDQVVSIACAATDSGSGVASTTCQNVGSPAYAFPLGTNTVSATAGDVASNVGTGSTTFTVKVTTPSLITLTKLFVTKSFVELTLVGELTLAAAAEARGEMKVKAKLIALYIAELKAVTGKAITAGNAAILTKLAQAL
jgi:hypothetical protein